jgi:hypothetical protein
MHSTFERRLGTGSKASAFGLFVVLALTFLAFVGSAQAGIESAPPPQIWSDKADYAPGEAVVLSGANWAPGDSVHIRVNDDVGQTWSRDVDVTADASGAISDQFNLPDWFVAAYSVTATGATSGTATSSFTDANFTFDNAVYPYRLAGGNVNFSTGGAGSGDHFIWHRKLPSGAYTYTGFTFNGSTSPSFTLALGATATGTYELNVGGSGTAAPATTCGGNSCGRYGIWGPNQSSFVVGGSLTIAGGGAKQSQAAGGANAVTVKLFNPGGGQVGSAVSLATDANGEYSSGTLRTFVAGDPSGTWRVEVSSNARYDANTAFTSSTNITFTGDAIPPDTTITANPAATTSDSSASFSFTGTDNVTPAGSLTFECKLDLGAFAACTSPKSYSALADGSHTFQVRATDAAGNVDGSPASFTWTIDTAQPTLTASAVKGTAPGFVGAVAYGENSWTNQDVKVSFSCSDNAGGSGVAAGSPSPASQTFDTEGVHTASSSCTDAAGNPAVAGSFGPVKIDKTAPVISGSAVTLPGDDAYSAGVWTNKSVKVSFSCADALSGVDSNSVAGETLTTNTPFAGTNVSSSGACTDAAGNPAVAGSFGPVKIDKTAPTITPLSRTPANGHGWNNGNVTVKWTCTDGLSGVVASPVEDVISAEGSNQTANGTCEDNADNSASDSLGNINVDKTAPSLSPTITPQPILLSGTHTASANATDSLSGVDSQSCGPVVTSSVGAKTLTCSATDNAGNTRSQSVPYVVSYLWDGFLQPINDTAHQTGLAESKFKLGQTIPAKFVIKNALGTVVQQSSNPTFSRSGNLGSCDLNAVNETITEVITPDSGVSYNWDGSQYHYNWSTKGLTNGEYRIYANLADGSKPYVDICLTK